MKYIVILGDGMADYPLEQLDNKTPLQRAIKPTVDYLARRSIMGTVKTVPEDLPPGSDTANLAVLGYDPHEVYSGRSPFEAASMGIKLADDDISFRCNLVTLSENEPYEKKKLLDYSAGEISSAEAKELIVDINRHLATEKISFYPGLSYRHLMVWEEGPFAWQLTPPHDIIGKETGAYLPAGKGSEVIRQMMEKSVLFLKQHEINKKRQAAGLNPANSIWIWGEGKKPALKNFYKKYKVKGSVISAVDLIKGIGLSAGLKSIDVLGSTATIDTDFVAEAEAALRELASGQDFVFLHIEAPDECGHQYEIENKVKAIELISEKTVKTIKEGLDKSGEDYKILFLPDHATPLSLRTHTRDAVPFLIYDSTRELDFSDHTYDENSARETGLHIAEGYKLMDYFLDGGSLKEMKSEK